MPVKVKVWHIAVLAALVYLICGGLALDNYGIGYDEEAQRHNNGYLNYNYVTGKDKEGLLVGNERYHGPAFELALIVIEKASGLKDVRHIYLLRHWVNFLVFFLSILVMYFLAQRVFKEDKWALFAALMYALCPRFFAEAYYNSKDIIFLAFFTFSLYSLYRLAKKPSVIWAIIHAVITGFMIDIRILGIFMPIASIAFVLYHQLLNGKDTSISKLALVLGIYGVFQALAVVAFWPILWEGPVFHLREAFVEMSHYHWTGKIRYMGEIYNENELPWHYLPVWMLITLPVPFLVLMLLGAGLIVTKLFSFNKEAFRKYEFDFLSLAVFIGPLALIILMKSIVYDGWRHVYFAYAPMVLISTHSAIWLWKKAKSRISDRHKKAAISGLFVLIFLGPLINIIRYHPYQFVYFNPVANAFFSPIGEAFEMDYWGLSYRQGLEHVLDNNEGKVKVMVQRIPGHDNTIILDKEQRQRLRYFENNYETVIYYLADYRATKEFEPGIKAELVHKIETPSGPFLWIYKTTDSLHVKEVLYTEDIDFERFNESSIDSNAYSGEKVDRITTNRDFGYTLVKTVDTTYLNGIFAAKVSAQFKSKEHYANVSYALSVDRDGETIFWRGKTLGILFNRPDEWVEWNFGYEKLNDLNLQVGDIIKVYFHGGSVAEASQDDVRITLLTYEDDNNSNNEDKLE